MMFVDASAIVAILAREPGFEIIANRLRTGSRALTSGMAVYEAVLALAPKRVSLAEAEAVVWAFVSVSQIGIVQISDQEARSAIEAFRNYGKGSDHPAQLTMGDCFACACARTHDVPRLFVGNDFSQTDIRSATD